VSAAGVEAKNAQVAAARAAYLPQPSSVSAQLNAAPET